MKFLGDLAGSNYVYNIGMYKLSMLRDKRNVESVSTGEESVSTISRVVRRDLVRFR